MKNESGKAGFRDWSRRREKHERRQMNIPQDGEDNEDGKEQFEHCRLKSQGWQRFARQPAQGVPSREKTKKWQRQDQDGVAA